MQSQETKHNNKSSYKVPFHSLSTKIPQEKEKSITVGTRQQWEGFIISAATIHMQSKPPIQSFHYHLLSSIRTFNLSIVGFCDYCLWQQNDMNTEAQFYNQLPYYCIQFQQ